MQISARVAPSVRDFGSCKNFILLCIFAMAFTLKLLSYFSELEFFLYFRNKFKNTGRKTKNVFVNESEFKSNEL